MVRTYKRKTDRQKWSEESMQKAIDEVLQNKMGYRKASAAFNVPQTTLERKVAIFRQNPHQPLKVSLEPFETVFSLEEEDELVVYLKEMEGMLFGLNTADLRKLAFQLAVKNNKNHKFDVAKEEAGLDWLKCFMKRHPDLSLRKPEATSAARAMGFNRAVVTKFFELLGQLYDQYQITPDRVYNCDETSVSSVPKSRSKIISSKGRKQVGALTSAERGQTVTVELCVSASGVYMPPMMIFPRQRMKDELLDGSAPGTWAECHPSGWMQSDIFVRWFKRFMHFTNASKDNRVLLLFDGHSTHTKNLELIDLARENGVILLCFPPHCTHRLQPLDVTFMKPLSTYYEAAVTNWLRCHPGRVVTMYQIASLFGSAFLRAATMTTAINGFKTTGIWPIHPEVFQDSDFLPSKTTDRPAPSVIEGASIQESSGSQVCKDNSVPSCSSKTTDRIMPDDVTEKDSTPESSNPVVNKNCIFPSCSFSTVQNNTGAFSRVSPKDTMPFPHVGKERNNSSDRRRGKTAILTESPYRNDLKAQTGKRAVSCKKKLNLEHRMITTKKSRATIKQKKDKDSEVKESEDAKCIFCGHLFSESTEAWVKCIECQGWAHCACAGEDDEDEDTVYVCDMCK